MIDVIKTLSVSLKIDLACAVNSFLYQLKKLPIFSDLLTDDVYQSKLIKKIVGVFAFVLSFCRMLVFRIFYFLSIYVISSFLSRDRLLDSFFHVYFVFTLIGIYLNTKILGTSRKKYYSIVLFQMDSKKYMKAYLWWNLFVFLLFHAICFSFFSFLIPYSFFEVILLLFLSFFGKIVGEALHLKFYRKYGHLWYDNQVFYFSVLIGLLILSLLPYFGFFFSFSFFLFFFFLFFILGIYGYFYLSCVDDYQVLYQRLNTRTRAMNDDFSRSYSRQDMIEMKDRDKVISVRKIQGKKGYDLFNTIFFERHKEILMRSARNYAIAIFFLIVCFAIFLFFFSSYSSSIHYFLLHHLGWFVLIVYFINRGAIVTQAMFYHCDHAMLSYNFYREPKVLLGLFKKRVIMISKINLVPAFVLALGIDFLLFLSGGTIFVNYLMIFSFILVLSIFFSVHYLVLYYLFQPYDRDMQIKSFPYSIACFFTYFLTYFLHDVSISSLLFSSFGLLITIFYFIIALIFVYRRAIYTFKLK